MKLADTIKKFEIYHIYLRWPQFTTIFYIYGTIFYWLNSWD